VERTVPKVGTKTHWCRKRALRKTPLFVIAFVPPLVFTFTFVWVSTPSLVNVNPWK
jgi:hypothetical protein